MAFGSSEPRVRPSAAASQCARRALRRRARVEPRLRAGGPEVVRISNRVARREPVSAPQLLGLFERHRRDRESAKAKGDGTAKSLELYALLGGAPMHRQAHAATTREAKADAS